MKLRVSVDMWCTTFAAALGLLPGCGGSSVDVNGSGGTGGAPSGVGGQPSMFACGKSMPLLVNGIDTGFSTCENGLLHRPTIGKCPVAASLPEICSQVMLPPGSNQQCATNADCKAKPYGQCGVGQVGCYCTYGCASDADCDAGSVCQCGEASGQCVPSTCANDQACPTGQLCAGYVSMPFCGGPALACQTSADQCAVDADCAARGMAGAVCTVENGIRICSPGNCVIGRPFLINGSERLAALSNSPDWIAEPTIDAADNLCRPLRDAVVLGWTRIALMEHASVAAFSRFSLQLLSLGAPSDLLEATQRAASDELRHAREAFGLASRYAEGAIGPGALSIEGALNDSSPEAILTTTLLEGCVGETVAAVEALELSLRAEDPYVRDLLRKVSDDEARHAELAYRAVRWLLGVHPELREAAAALGRRVLAEDPPCEGSDEEERAGISAQELHAYGLASPELSREIRTRVLESVVRPCLSALVDPRVVASPSTHWAHA
ncbi:MAG: ferritin-like domain-containing protein [Polyangiaceae bacterium]|nr:ferritin-like domain-containing protein [Polyangiaceae bacterium]